MVGRREGHHVDIGIFQQLTHVSVTFHLLAAVFAFLGFAFQHMAIHIAQGCQPSAFDTAHAADVVAAPSVEPHHRETNVSIRANHTRSGRSRSFDLRLFFGSHCRPQADRGGAEQGSF